jgi:hypothetical protein
MKLRKFQKNMVFDLTGCEQIDPATYSDNGEMFNLMMELRKGKLTEEKSP